MVKEFVGVGVVIAFLYGVMCLLSLAITASI